MAQVAVEELAVVVNVTPVHHRRDSTLNRCARTTFSLWHVNPEDITPREGHAFRQMLADGKLRRLAFLAGLRNLVRFQFELPNEVSVHGFQFQQPEGTTRARLQFDLPNAEDPGSHD